MENTSKKIAALEERVAALEKMLAHNMAEKPVDMLSIREKARIIRAAHASGKRSEVIKANRLINGL